MISMTAVIYARYSSSSQREASIEEQVKICEQFAKRHDYMVTHVYKDSANWRVDFPDNG